MIPNVLGLLDREIFSTTKDTKGKTRLSLSLCVYLHTECATAHTHTHRGGIVVRGNWPWFFVKQTSSGYIYSSSLKSVCFHHFGLRFPGQLANELFVYNEVTKGMNLLNREGRKIDKKCVLVIPPTHIGSQIGTGGLVVRWRRHSARCHNARCKNVFLFF